MELAGLWTPGVQDGVVSGIVLVVLTAIGVWLRKSLLRLTLAIKDTFSGSVAAPKWFLLLLGGLMLGAGFANGTEYALDAIIIIGWLACMGLIALGKTTVSFQMPAAVRHRLEVPPLQFTDTDREIFRLYMRQERPEQRLTSVTIANEIRQSVHLVQHRIDVLRQEGLLCDVDGHGLTSTSYYLSAVGRVTALRFVVADQQIP